jgi:hypothetical protein
MKKLNLIIISIVVVSFISVLLIYPVKVNSQKEKVLAVAGSVPDSLNKIFTNSCMPCHYNGGSKGANFALNFSNWNKYSPEKQAKKSAAIFKKVSDGSMPPKSFKEGKPLTKAQVISVGKWTNSLIKK